MKVQHRFLARDLKLNKVRLAVIKPEGNEWKSLYSVAAYAALLMVFLIPIQMIVFFISPPPATIEGWFQLFQENAIIGLIDMDLLLSLDYLLLALVFLALYAILSRYNPSMMAIALVVQLMAISIYYTSTGAFEMLSLSKLYNLAQTDAEKNQITGAARLLLVSWQGTAFNVSYVLGGVSLSIVSVVMRRTGVFRKSIPNLGILMGALMLVPPTVGMIGLIISLLSLIPLVPWLLLLAQRFLQLKNESRDVKKDEL
jgi:hypothetical protein